MSGIESREFGERAAAVAKMAASATGKLRRAEMNGVCPLSDTLIMEAEALLEAARIMAKDLRLMAEEAR